MTDLKPGQIAQHPKHGYGIVIGSRIRGRGRDHVVVSSAADGAGYDVTGLTDWTPADILPAGHVAVKVDDLGDDALDTIDGRRKGASPQAPLLEFRARKAWLAWMKQQKSAQPDEPTTFGAQVTVTRPSGEVEKWLRGDDGSEPWISENTLWWAWKDLSERGHVTLGWPQDATDGDLSASQH